MSLALGDEIELQVERLASGGDGVGRFQGLAIFVPYTAPGDRVRVRVCELFRRHARAELAEILAPGEGRREPMCPVYGRCGGCTWMHLDEATQSRARREILVETLRRIGKLERLPEVEWLPSPHASGYRARARIAYGEDKIGFRAPRSHEVVDVERCAVLDEATQKELDRVRAARPSGAGELEIRGFGERALDLHVSPGSFFQANGSLWPRWAETVADACGSGALAVELYAGVGFYTAHLARRFAQVVAVERSAAARDLERNVAVRVYRTAAERFARARLAALAPDLVLLNPPRAGCHPSLVEALRAARPPRIVYVSCDPSTLARDVARLGPGFAVQRVISIDALPQTHHIEALLSIVSC